MSHLLLLSRALAVVCCFLFVRSASATDVYTYSPKGPITLKSAPGDTVTQVIAIKNMRPYSTSTNVALNTAGGHFSMNVTSYYITLYKDSTFNVIIKYVPTTGDTSYGWLRIYDSLTVPDTVFITGMDTTVQYTRPAWQIDSSSGLTAGDFYSRPDSALVKVKNYSNSSVTVTATMLVGGYGFSAVGSQQRTIAVGSNTNFLFRFNANSDSGYARVLFHSDERIDTVILRGKRIVVDPPSGDTLAFEGYHNFGIVHRGDTLCYEAVIHNLTDSAVEITEFGFDFGNPTFYLSQPPALPLLIESGDSLEVVVCFRAPSAAAEFKQGQFYFTSGFDNYRQEIFMWGQSDGCVTATPDTIDFGAVATDGFVQRGITFTNLSNQDVTIDSAYFLANQPQSYALDATLPLTIRHSSDTLLRLSFIPVELGANHGSLVLMTTCGYIIVDLSASVVYASDTTTFELFADTTQTLEFSADSSFATQVFHFVNDLPDSIRIKSVALKQNEHFMINDIDPHYPVLDLASTDWMDVTLQFYGSPGTYDDTLVIVTENMLQSLYFPIHGVMQGSDVRAPRVAMPSLRVSPNPASGPVMIQLDHAQKATIEVLDVMGKLVTRFGGNGSWDHSEAASGTYFVRATGLDESGKPFVTTSRIVLQ